MNSDLSDELSAINSIYGPSTIESALGSSPASPTSTYVLHIPHASASSSAPPTLALRISFPPSYPAQPPSILGNQTTTASAGEEEKRLVQIARDALERVYTPEAVVLFDLIEEVRGALEFEQSLEAKSAEEAEGHPDSTNLESGHTAIAGSKETMYRCIFYFHHIYSSKKIRTLHDLAQTYRLVGIMKTSRPGFLFAQTLPSQSLVPSSDETRKSNSQESKEEVLERFTKEVKAMRWQEAKLVYFEAVDRLSEPVKGNGTSTTEKQKPGFVQVEKMSNFSAWMHERGLGEILKESVLR